jgi:hypothetical protein
VLTHDAEGPPGVASGELLRWEAAVETTLDRGCTNKCAVAVSFFCKSDESLILLAGRGSEGKEDTLLVLCGPGRWHCQRHSACSWVLFLLSAGHGGEGEGNYYSELPCRRCLGELQADYPYKIRKPPKLNCYFGCRDCYTDCGSGKSLLMEKYLGLPMQILPRCWIYF